MDHCGLNIVDEINSGVHERHIYAGSMHIASNTTGTVEYYHVDHLGSTRLKTNSTGGATYESNYEPFGVSNGEDGSEDYRYTGKHEDTTGLYYFGARYYDPAVGRFITRDTVFGELTDPQSQNKYVYCLNNPHKYTDPDGQMADYVDDLYGYSSLLPVDPLTKTVIILGVASIPIYQKIKQEAQRHLKALMEGGKDAFFYGSENPSDWSGMVTHFEIGRDVSYITSSIGRLGGGYKNAIKRRMKQQAFLEGKPGIETYPPDYTENEFILDTIGGAVKLKGDNIITRSLSIDFNYLIDYMTNSIKDRWHDCQIVSNQVKLKVPDDYIDAGFR